MTRKKRAKRKKAKKSAKSKFQEKKKASFLEGPIHKTKIRVVGIGGGRNSIVSEIAQRIRPLGKKKISFLVANTDLRALKRSSSKATRFYFGKEITFGLGTGMNPELGEAAAKREKEKITNLLKGQDLIVLVACLGGGVGSGATPFFAQISKNLGNLTLGIFTLPFKFEGEKKIEIAKSALRKLRRRVNTLAIIPNERIFQVIDKKTPLTKALSAINKSLTEGLEGLLAMIYQPGLINIDFADLKTILGGRGKLAFLNSIEVKGPDRSQKAPKELISSPLYPYTISGAKGILFDISAEENLKLSEVSQISKAIWGLVKGKAKIIFGISRSSKQKNKIKISLLATGCKSKISLVSKKSKPKRIKVKKKEPKKISKSPKRVPKKKTKSKKIKVKIKPKSSIVKEKKEKEPAFLNKEEEESPPKVRRNALEVKKALKEEEEKILAEEKKWETPAFLRRK